MPRLVMGVDASRRGWVGAVSDGRYVAARTIGDLVLAAEELAAVEVVAIDIPIGLPERGFRQADVQARKAVGTRWPSVFMTPPRPALAAASYAEGNAECRLLTGLGLSAQAYALGPKIFEVESWASTAACTVVEVHPELSFRMMADHPLSHPKSSWAGAAERFGLLSAEGLAPAGDLGAAGVSAGVDDVLDATAGLWSALRYARGEARSHPDAPEPVTHDCHAAIWA